MQDELDIKFEIAGLRHREARQKEIVDRTIRLAPKGVRPSYVSADIGWEMALLQKIQHEIKELEAKLEGQKND